MGVKKMRFFGRGKQKSSTMSLEQQLDVLAALGLRLNDGVTVDDLLYSLDRKEYEERPFDLLLFRFGGEVERAPWGRDICSCVWNFDTERPEVPPDYTCIIERLCVLAGEPDRLTNISDFVDVEAGEAWLEYTVESKEQRWDVEVNDDWADTLTLAYVMADIKRDGKRFYSIDNGQAMLLFYLTPSVAEELSNLSKHALQPVIPD
jgi:hypothetical protein